MPPSRQAKFAGHPQTSSAYARHRRPNRPPPWQSPRSAQAPAPAIPPPDPRVRHLRLAAAVIAHADRDHPADTVLRQTLRSETGLTPADSRAISRAVFAFFRWRGWLKTETGLPLQIERALELADAWKQEPNRFPIADLRARALPLWVGTGAAMAVGPVDPNDLAGCPSPSHPSAFWPNWLHALQDEPPVWVRARLRQGDTLARELGDCTASGAGPLADALRYGGTTDLFRAPAFAQGRFEIQDAHSQAVGWLCNPRPDESWWDACAGEGGKLLHLADLMNNHGRIWATDRAAWRLRRLKLRAARAGVFNYRTRLWTGAAALPTHTRFDGVLLDAPCSNLGTWHRNPHARWTVTPPDITELATLQASLLDRVLPALKPGGRLFYAVCTLTHAETVNVVRGVNERHPELESLPLIDPWAPTTPPRPWLWLTPRPGGGNGMFVAAWRRQPS